MSLTAGGAGTLIWVSLLGPLATIPMLRAERKVSRRELADALGVHYQTVGYLERGEYSPSLHLALRIAVYFEVPVEVIFSTEPFPRLGSASATAG